VKLLLIITVLAVGGPHRTTPFPLRDATVRIMGHRHRVVVNTDTDGQVEVRLFPGRYRLEASSGRPCNVVTITIHHPERVSLDCSIP
jgi:hypothetical protein